eukprot:CAMPEP_0185022718 /NCGR_PEP_ID=MMETSP1103-20130426/5423_1 /TAXON_ID=36769 /ORGANISM="Paraphysomonas bandaiensis, Strain Caron Lab Isolate" /LENGTH=2181 /DNA_ID=CAMNT_0027554929 /DNA_START=20 /DNA_END=6565 /DNA_ORIENTATION=+
MAEAFQRNKLYEYRANSNLVLEADREVRRRADEATGEVETLHGKLGSVRMGDRLERDKHEDLNDRIKKAHAKRQLEEANREESKRKKKNSGGVFIAGKGSNVLSVTENMDSINYRPKTRESRAAYEEMLSFIQISLGDQPQDILMGAAEEVLSILKDDSMRDPDRHREIEKILSRIPSDKFSKLVNLGKQITDFNMGGNEEEETTRMDEGVGVAVVFDDDEDDMNEDLSEEHDSDEDDDGGVEAMGGSQLKGVDDEDMDADIDSQVTLSVHDIDAHWLQRQLSKFYNDANVSAKLAEDTLNVLQISDERGCENQLVVLLDFNKFDFIKLLLRNRAKILYCTKLKQAQSDAEREAIEVEMRADVEGGGAAILDQLQQTATAESWAADRIGEFANKARREARALNRSGGDIRGSDEVEETVGGVAAIQNGRGSGAGTEKTLDLDSLQFAEGGHLMSNSRCELPEKSWRAQKKGYEEVHVPALRPIISSKEKLVQVTDLPVWCQPAFTGVKALNRIQSRMVESALKGSDNILLCAPTGAGKTNVALMCMLSVMSQYRKDDGSIDLDGFKIVYVAPMKALVQEVVQNFSKKLAPFGITVRELSGDQNLTRQQIQETQLIVTTPEKWDIVTRKAGDRAYTQLVRLMIIDEIHLLHDDRGPVLEALVARTIRQIETTQDMVRMVGLSATLPNFEDVATFLRVDPEKGLFFFDNSFRPVPLQQQYIGVTEKKALKRFQLMNEICYEKVLQHAGRNQVLIFTHSRAETAKTARALRDMAMDNDALSQFVKEDSASREILREEGEAAKNPDLKDLLPHGFAIHHAGLVRSDRTLVEDLFADKHVQVLVSTATLAWGVNLPAHTVILKGTQMYSPEQGRWVELSPLDIMQMMGRAGRYGMDSEGEGIIITAHSELQYYLSLMNQQLPIESQFIKKLPDMLNAEIVLGTVQSVREAASWLGYTYLFIRMLRNPEMYSISADELNSDPVLMQRRMDLAHSAAVILDRHNLIRYDRKSGMFQVTALGRVASHYYVSHDSINVFNEYLKPTMSDIEIFRLFSLSGEFKYIHVREEEKLELTKLLTRVPIPVKEGVEEPAAKVNVLLQSYVSRLRLEGFALVADMTYIQQSACRLMRCLFEVALKRGWASLANKTLAICKMVERRTWGSQSPLRQFGAIPEVIIRKLEKNSDINWERYYDLKPQDLGEMVKIPKMGKTLHKYVHMFPKLELSAHFQPITRSLLMVDLTITPDFQFDTSVHDYSQLFWVIVEDVNGERILHHEAFILRKNYASEEHHISFSVTLSDPLPPQYFIRVVSDRWMHAETILPVSFRHILLPHKYPPPTELLDLQPLPVSALRNSRHENLFRSTFKHFNPIQTQTFSALYEGDDNALVCAPTGSGKTICAEFAMLRLFSANSDARCVYVTPKQETCDLMYEHWRGRFQKNLNLSVVKLVGDITPDLKLLESGNIIIATAVQWDVLSRRWKQRKIIQNIALYIFDEVHLIGGADGATLEIVASRARYVASQLGNKVRVVLLGSSIANAKDIADWMGVPNHAMYNFPPSVRPVPLEIHMHGFETNHFGNRLLAMAKPTYTAIIGHSPDKPAIVFVPSRKQCQLTAIDIITYAAAGGTTDRFLHTAPENIAEVLATFKEPALAQTVAHGVGFVHMGLLRSDKNRVLGLYRDGIIQVLVCPFDMCWSLSIPAHLVVVMETTYYDGREHSFVNYSITDVMQMLGLASRPLTDDTGKAVILCHSPKKDYLKRLVNDPLPVESHIDQFLHDHLTAEIVTKTIENKQDAVDYLTWTFYYRRLTQNPNYYNLQGTSHRHLSDHLSELIEVTIADLEQSKCISVEDDIDLSPLNLGMIASYYYIQYTTVELFASSITAKSKIKGLMEILSSASEYSSLNIRQSEETVLAKLAKHLPQALPATAAYENPSTKALLLMQAHFCRRLLGVDLTSDQKIVLAKAPKLIQSLVDVISSQSWLRPALASMELSQMIVQGQWDKDSVLLQVPHFTDEIIARCKQNNPPVESVFDVLDLEDEERNKLLQLTPEKMSDVAVFCNAYPNIELLYDVSVHEGEEVEAGDTVTVMVTLQREIEEEDEVDPTSIGKVVCPRYPTEKVEGWWLVVGDTNSNSLLSIKRLNIGVRSKAKLEFSAPDDPGDYNLTLYLMSDSYLGCDQEYEIPLTVVAGDEDMDDEE